jgi:hypothetical protein
VAGPIRIAILANASQAKRQLTETASAAERLSGRMSRLRLPATLALTAVAAGSKKAVDAASDLNEEISKSQQIFGRQAAGIERFATGAAASLGQSKQAALEATSTFGLIAQKAGLAGGESAKFATQFTSLASDLASFNNTTPEEAITAIGAALRGESEPIRKYGVLLDDATLRARALKLGLIETTSQALTPQQKALAASQEILAQTTKAQGDFARTSDGAANKSRIMAAQTENLAAGLGQSLLPAYQRALELGTKFVGVLAEHPTATKAAIVVIVALAAGVLAMSAASAVAGAALTAYNGVTIAFTAIQKAATAASLGTRIGLAALAVQTAITSAVTKAAAVAQAALNAVMLANPITLVVLAIVALVAAFVIAYKKSETFRAIVDAAFAGIKKAITVAVAFVVGFVRNNWKKLLVLLTGPIGVAVLLIIKYWDRIKAATRAVWSAVKSIIQTYLGAVRAVITTVFNVYRTVVLGVWNAIRNATRAVWSAVTAVVRNQINLVVGVIQGLRGRVVGAFSAAGSWLLDAGRRIIQGLIDGISSMIGAVRDKLGSVTNLIPDWKGPAERDARLLEPAGRLIMGGLIRGIDREQDGLRRKLGEVTETIRRGVGARSSLEVGLNGALTNSNTTIIRLHLTAEQIDQVQRGKSIQADLDAYKAVGGRRRAV